MLEFLTDHFSEVASFAAGAGGGLVAAGLKAAYDRVSGTSQIEENAANIMRIASTKENLQKIFDAHSNVGSIIFVDTDRAHILVRKLNSGGTEYGSFALTQASQAAQFQASKRHLTDPMKVARMALVPRKPENVSSECAEAAQRAQRNWTRPWIRIGRDFQKMAFEVNKALMKNASVLADDGSNDINLSNVCHIAAKWTCVVQGHFLSNIVVMPVSDSEGQHLGKFLKGELPDATCLSGEGIIRALESYHLGPQSPH